MFQFVIVQESDVMELEKRYWTLKSGTKTGKFDLETFTSLVSPPIPQCLCPGINECFICIGNHTTSSSIWKCGFFKKFQNVNAI